MDKDELKSQLGRLIDGLGENSHLYKTLENIADTRARYERCVFTLGKRKSTMCYDLYKIHNSGHSEVYLSYEGPRKSLTQMSRDAKSEVSKPSFVPQQILQYDGNITVNVDPIKSNYDGHYILSVGHHSKTSNKRTN